MLDKVRHLLLDAINPEQIIGEEALAFYTRVEESEDEEILEKIESYETLNDYVQSDDLEAQEFFDDLDYDLDLQFDRVEDSVKDELLHGKLMMECYNDIKNSGIIVLEGQALNEDQVEEFYLEAFQDFDRLKAAISKTILNLSPTQFYTLGGQERDKFRQAHGLKMDEGDMIAMYRERFNKDRLFQIFARKIYESIHYHRHYELELPDQEESYDGPVLWNPEDDAQDGPDEPNLDDLDSVDVAGLSRDDALSFDEMAKKEQELEEDATLVPGDDMSPADFTYVYELLGEYNGRRILPSDDEWSDHAYWQQYADEFEEILGYYVVTAFEDTLKYVLDTRPADYTTLAHYLGLSDEQKRSPEAVLEHSDKLTFYIEDLESQLWEELCNSELQPLYDEGEKLAK